MWQVGSKSEGVTFDGQFVRIRHASGGFQGKKEIVLHVDEITSVDYTPSRGMAGRLVFTASGYSNVVGDRGRQRWATMTENPLGVLFYGQNEAAIALRNAVLVAKYGSAPVEPMKAPATATNFPYVKHVVIFFLTAGLSTPWTIVAFRRHMKRFREES